MTTRHKIFTIGGGLIFFLTYACWQIYGEYMGKWGAYKDMGYWVKAGPGFLNFIKVQTPPSFFDLFSDNLNSFFGGAGGESFKTGLLLSLPGFIIGYVAGKK